MKLPEPKLTVQFGLLLMGGVLAACIAYNMYKDAKAEDVTSFDEFKVVVMDNYNTQTYIAFGLVAASLLIENTKLRDIFNK